MLVKVDRDRKLILPGQICQRLRIGMGDRLNVFVKGGRIVIQPIHRLRDHLEESSKNGRGRILMFGTASEAFDDEDLD